jgi:hypothetical protein
MTATGHKVTTFGFQHIVGFGSKADVGWHWCKIVGF